MPNWKKVITSGSNAQLNQITASGDISVGDATVKTLTLTHHTDGTDRSAYPGNFYMGSNNVISSDDSLYVDGAFRAGDGIFIVSNSPTTDEVVTIDGNMNISSHITASGDISSSGIIHSSSSIKTNLTKLVTYDDATGIFHITASSGFVNGAGGGTTTNGLTAGTGVDMGNGTGGQIFNGASALTLNLDLTEVITSDGANRVLTSDGDGTLTAEANLAFDGNGVDVTGHITASGTISASGTIIADAITTGNSAFHNGIFNSGPVNPKLKISSSNDILIESSDDIFFKSDGTTIAQIKGGEAILDLNGTLDVSSHITSSGNISSSGIINASASIKSNLTKLVTYDDATGIFHITASSGFVNGDGGGDGDMTGVDLTGGSGITIGSETNTTSGDYSATISVASATISGSFLGQNVLSGSALEGTRTIISGSVNSTGSFGRVEAVGIITAEGLVISDDAEITDDLTVNGDIDLEGDIDVNGTANLDAVDIDGNVQLGGNLTVGTNGSSHDIEVHSNTSGKKFNWHATNAYMNFVDNTKLSFGTPATAGGYDSAIYSDGTVNRFQGVIGDILLDTHGDNCNRVFISGSGQSNFAVHGHITASGNISASGNVITSQVGSADDDLLVRGENITNTLDVGGDFIIQEGVTERLKFDGGDDSFTLTGNITTSGNISSSGTIISNDITADAVTGVDSILNTGLKVGRDSTDLIDFTSDNQIKFRVNDVNEFVLAENIFRPGGSGGAGLGNSAKKWSELVVNHITASNNISASGLLMSSASIKGNLTKLVTYDDATGQYHITASSGFVNGSSGGGSGDMTGVDLTGGTNVSIASETNTTSGDYSATINLDDSITLAGDFLQSGPGAGNYVSSSQGNLELSGSGKGQLEVDYRLFDTGSGGVAGSVGQAVGDVIKFGGSVTSPGLLYHLTGTGTWSTTRRDIVGTCTGSLAIALGTNSTNDGMMIRGMVSCSTQFSYSSSIGGPVYIGSSAGKINNTVSSTSGDIVRVVGHSYGNGVVYFNPDNTFIEVA